MNANLDPLITLNNIFPNKQVVFCLGNHEFAYRRHHDVLDFYSKFKNDFVHCLDIDGNFKYDNFNFVGNVFWYNFTMSTNKQIMKGEIDKHWLDSTIEEFDPIAEHKKCIAQIRKNLDANYNNVLITHTCPHWKLNTFAILDKNDLFNYYSGCNDYLKYLKNKNIKWAFCRHTHKYEAVEIYGINCVNIGNDYYFRTKETIYKEIDL